MVRKRVFTKHELKEMGKNTADAAIAAVEAGDREKAVELINRLRDESRTKIDTFVNWVADLMDYIYVHDGEEGLDQALRKCFESRVASIIEWSKKTYFRGQVETRAASLRGFLYDLEIEEDDEKVSIKMSCCGSGQRLVESGAYKPPRKLSLMKPHRLTYGLSNFPVYCAHAPAGEIMAMEQAGHPPYSRLFGDEVGKESCRFCIYKDPKYIPEEVYTRVGMKKPKK